MVKVQFLLQVPPVLLTKCCFTKLVPCCSVLVTQSRGVRYKKSGGMIGGRRRRLPLNWRDLNYNPARIPSAWKPDDWDKKQRVDYEREQELAKYIPGNPVRVPYHLREDFHKEPIYMINKDGLVSEGLKQAMFLTKTIIADKGLPSRVKNIAESVRTPEQDDRVIQVFRHAHIFDVDPRSLDKKNATKVYKQDNYMIFPTPDRYCPLILKELIRLCETKSHQLSENFYNRILVENAVSTASFQRDCTSLDMQFLPNQQKCWKIHMNASPVIQIRSKNPLHPFADGKDVKATTDIPLFSMHPMLPIIDLKKTNNYSFINKTGFTNNFTRPHLHTMVLYNIKQRAPNSVYGRMLVHLFTSLYTQAQQIYGDTPQNLPKPLTAQCIASDGRVFHFMCFQLNTTLLNSDEGVKNMVWVDNESVISELYDTTDYMQSRALYGQCSHLTWESPTYYTDFDSSVFDLFQGMWLHGVV